MAGLAHERLLEALRYDPETGFFTRLLHAASNARAGEVAGSPNSGGYWVIVLDGQRYRAHVLAWFYMTGEWPIHHIDHIDGDTLNNRFTNLRNVPRTVNMRNIVAPQRNNTTGYRGVTKTRHGRFQAQIEMDGKNKFLGVFNTPEEARDAYWSAKTRVHGIETFQERLLRESP